MTQQPPLTAEILARIRTLDTCTVSNAIEQFNIRLRNEGFAHGAIRCQFPQFPPVLGYAATARVRSSTPPMTGGCYYDRIDWWEYVLTIPEPRILVLQDVDQTPGFGAFVGEVHAHIALALNCVGCVTDGAVRDLPAVKATGFQLFARCAAVSHAYAHIAEFGEPVEIGGLKIAPGDLIHGDRHGVHIVPQSIAADIPKAAADIMHQERELIELCQSPDFSLQKLSAALEHKLALARNRMKIHYDSSL